MNEQVTKSDSFDDEAVEKIKTILTSMKEKNINSVVDWLIFDYDSFEWAARKRVLGYVILGLGWIGFTSRAKQVEVLDTVSISEWKRILIYSGINTLPELKRQKFLLHRYLCHLKNNEKRKKITSEIKNELTKKYKKKTDEELLSIIDFSKVCNFHQITHDGLRMEIYARKNLKNRILKIFDIKNRRKKIRDAKKEFLNIYQNTSPESVCQYIKENNIKNLREIKNRYVYIRIVSSKRLKKILNKNIGWLFDELKGKRCERVELHIPTCAAQLYEKSKLFQHKLHISKINLKIYSHLRWKKKYWLVKFYILFRSGGILTNKGSSHYVWQWSEEKIIEFLTELEIDDLNWCMENFSGFEMLLAKYPLLASNLHKKKEFRVANGTDVAQNRIYFKNK